MGYILPLHFLQRLMGYIPPPAHSVSRVGCRAPAEGGGGLCAVTPAACGVRGQDRTRRQHGLVCLCLGVGRAGPDHAGPRAGAVG